MIKQLLFFSCCFMLTLIGYSQEQGPSTISQGNFIRKTGPLRDFPLSKTETSGKSNYKIIPNNFPVNGYEAPNYLPVGGDPIRQTAINIVNRSRNLQQSFDGPNAAKGQATPPDPSGAVGPNHYVSAVNL